jgi:hypothetical protein
MAGNPLEIGDRVAVTYRTGGKGSHWALRLAYVVRHTPTGVRVSLDHPSGAEEWRRHSQVVRVPL